MVPVLGLRPLNRTPRICQGQCHLLGACRPLWWVRVSGNCQGEVSRAYQAQTDQDLVMEREGSAQFTRVRGKKGPHARAAQLSLSQILTRSSGELKLSRAGSAGVKLDAS